MRRATAVLRRSTPARSGTRCGRPGGSGWTRSSSRSTPAAAMSSPRSPGSYVSFPPSRPSPSCRATTGVRSAVDCTEPAGWRRLRDLVGHPASPVAARILARVVPALDEGSGDVRAFFEAVARLAPVLSTVRRLARHLRICSSTLMSRFYRAGLPSPKTYLAGMRLVHAAYLFSNPGLSVADVAYRLDYSSPQSFGRHLKAMLGVTAGEFRRRFPFDVSLERYVDLLVTPYRDILRAFHPLNAGMWDQGPNAARVSRAG